MTIDIIVKMQDNWRHKFLHAFITKYIDSGRNCFKLFKGTLIRMYTFSHMLLNCFHNKEKSKVYNPDITYILKTTNYIVDILQ
jgi:hypothetical protein